MLCDSSPGELAQWDGGRSRGHCLTVRLHTNAGPPQTASGRQARLILNARSLLVAASRGALSAELDQLPVSSSHWQPLSSVLHFPDSAFQPVTGSAQPSLLPPFQSSFLVGVTTDCRRWLFSNCATYGSRLCKFMLNHLLLRETLSCSNKHCWES